MSYYFVTDYDYATKEDPVRAVAKASSFDELKAQRTFNLKETYLKQRDSLTRKDDHTMTFVRNDTEFAGAIYEVQE